MPNGKSQLDVYRIDRRTVVDDIIESVEQTEGDRINNLMEKVTAGEPTTEEIQELSKRIIKYIIDKQNRKPKVLHYNELTLNPSSIRGYELVLYEASSIPQSPIATILGDRFVRNPKTGMNVSHILFVYDKNAIFVFCSGAGWQVVTPYVDSFFGLQLLSRLIPQNEEAISAARCRGFAGSVAAQETSYRKKARASDIVEFGRLFKDLSGRISAETVREELGLEISAGRKNVGANFKNSFRIRKSLSLAEFGDTLLKITELLENEPLFSIEEWLGISPLGRTQKDKALQKKLFSEAYTKICDAALNENREAVEVFVCDPQLSKYMSANSYKLKVGNGEYQYEEFFDETDLNAYITKLAEQLSEGEERNEKLVGLLENTYINSYADGNPEPITASELRKCLQLSIVYERRTYILIDGEWYTVYEGLERRLNRELPKLISGRMSSISLPAWLSGVQEDDYLNLLSSQCMHAKLHRKRPLDQVELCDTVVLDGKRLVFCHVKEGFDTDMRVLTAQVRSSAQVLAGLRSGNRLEELKAAWQHTYADIDNIPDFSIVEKAILGSDGYGIVECIVFHPARDLTISVEWSNSVIAKYELSALIKGWEFDFPLEIALPKD